MRMSESKSKCRVESSKLLLRRVVSCCKVESKRGVEVGGVGEIRRGGRGRGLCIDRDTEREGERERVGVVLRCVGA